MTGKVNHNKCEVPLELNDIRQSLDKISDTGLALDLLQKVEQLETTFKEKDQIINDMKENEERLKDLNQKLYVQVTAHSLTPKPNENVNYDGVDPVQNIIKHI